MPHLNEFGFPIIIPPIEPEPPDQNQLQSIWNCIDPCAFICYAVQINALPFDDEIKRTLDSFGWLNPDGFPDYEQMRRHFESTPRVRQIQ